MYCLPEPFPVTVVAGNDALAPVFLQEEAYQNISIVQFISWNPDTDLKNLFRGEVICVG